MAWVAVLWHLLALGLGVQGGFGASSDLLAATPGGFAAGLVLAALLALLLRRAPVLVRARPVVARRRVAARAPHARMRATDPDAPGRPRPRAPSSAPAAG